MRRMVCLLFAAALAAMPVIVHAGPPAPLSTPELRQAIGAKDKVTLVFFQNPYGNPCRMQKQVLDGLLAERKNNFNVVPVSTVKQEDQKAFYDYGVRNLPTLVLVDKAGRIAKVFPPGIQSREVLILAMDAIK